MEYFYVKYSKPDDFYSVYRRTTDRLGSRKVDDTAFSKADLPTIHEAMDFCNRDGKHVIFRDDKLPNEGRGISIGSLEKLFCNSNPGFVAVRSVVDGFNNLVVRAHTNPKLTTAEGIRLSLIQDDINRLASFWSLRVNDIRERATGR